MILSCSKQPNVILITHCIAQPLCTPSWVKLMTGPVRIPEAPPNLVFIITDDQGYGDLSLHGNTILETPHLDSIGIRGCGLTGSM